MKIAMIMLAAGNSRRFGSNKLLYPVDGIPMYKRTLGELEQVRKKNLTEIKITVVTQYKEIGDYAKAHGMEVLYNPHPEEGISSSLKIGLKANMEKQTRADACLFCVSDQPRLTAATLCRLVEAFQASDKGIACLSHGGRLGNPCMFSEAYYKELLSLEGDKGGKRVVMAHMEDTEILEVFDKRELEDMDFLTEERYTEKENMPVNTGEEQPKII